MRGRTVWNRLTPCRRYERLIEVTPRTAAALLRVLVPYHYPYAYECLSLKMYFSVAQMCFLREAKLNAHLDVPCIRGPKMTGISSTFQPSLWAVYKMHRSSSNPLGVLVRCPTRLRG